MLYKKSQFKVNNMTEKELKKLNRFQLLELIIMQTEEMQKLTAELEQTKALLKKQQITMASAGNIAQASMKLSGIFEVAQMAADMYLNSVKEYADKADKIIEEAKQQAEQIIEDAKGRAAQIESEEDYE